MYLIFV